MKRLFKLLRCWFWGGHLWDRAYGDNAGGFRKMCGRCERLGVVWGPGCMISGTVVKKEGK